MQRSKSPARVASSPSHEPLRALKAAEEELRLARARQEESSQLVARLEHKLNEAKEDVQRVRSEAIMPVCTKRLSTAYALWLLCPFIWPGAYLFYLGRDTHAWLHTVSFGGFGIGWLLDLFYIPLYVADYNEPAGYFERIERRNRSWVSLSGLVAAPFKLTLQLILAIYLGAISANLVPRPVELPDALLTALQMQQPSKALSATTGFCLGMLVTAVVMRLAVALIGCTRSRCRWRPVLAWSAICSALLSPMNDDGKQAEEGQLPRLCVGAIGVMIGAVSGRVAAMDHTPRRCRTRRLTVRLLLQLVGVGAFAGAALGAFYLNGSYTYSDKDTGETKTMAGPEALAAAWEGVGALSADVRQAAGMLWERQKGRSWSEIYAEIREAFRDPSVEAAEELGIAVDAPAEEIKRAHRQLARLHHPDKVEPAAQEEAKKRMQKLNWAKEVMLSKAGAKPHD
jgi:DnaJ family protein C protein 22